MSDVVEAEGVEEGLEVVPVEQVGSTLFRTNDPVLVLTRAVETAEALMPVVREKHLVARIQGREYLNVEAWQTLGAMLGVTPVCTWTRKLDDGWEARVEARTLDGRVVGAAEAECLRAESLWSKRDDFALRSMAQTRATSKALASVLRFVATLGGAAGTPAEEMPRDGGSSNAGGGEATGPQKAAITRTLRKHGVSDALMAKVVEAIGGKPLTKAGASKILDRIGGKDRSFDDTAAAISALIDEAGGAASDIPGNDNGLPTGEPDEGTELDLEARAEAVDQS